MPKETEKKGDQQLGCNQVPESKGYIDHRFQTPVMAINLTADSVPEDYKKHLNNGGDKIDS
ncbi:hypothetical protein KJ570_03470 [Patescibacteria group bacterium]|nr:hypothetical protein [Patescibacteria group bacterium]